MTTLHPVILCGGSGTRLWPASRKSFPKQFAPLLGERSLYQTTLARLSHDGYAAPLVMTGETFRFMAVAQANEIGLMDARVVVEPVARDTAPALLAAALMLADTPDDLMLVAPSDHVVLDPEAFHTAVDMARQVAVGPTLVTFGIRPERAETGFGYLQLAARPDGPTAVQSFTEKPDTATAETMLAAGNYLWNSGLFLGRIGAFLSAFEAHAPDLLPPVRDAVDAAKEDLGFSRLEATAFARARSVSVDYAVMEHTKPVMAVPLDCGWSDLGSWDAIRQTVTPDTAGNASTGNATLIDCEDSYLRSEEDSLALVGLGLKDVIAVAMRDAVLVADKSRAQDVKSVVETLRGAGASQADDYPRFHRPWGWYETLCLGPRFQVKRIMVHPGGVVSLQSHCHRAEHWVVVAGTAEVTVGSTSQLLTENQSIYIPLGETHRMANPGKVPMYLIEVQTGAYLGEDDIKRYEDIYDRS